MTPLPEKYILSFYCPYCGMYSNTSSGYKSYDCFACDTRVHRGCGRVFSGTMKKGPSAPGLFNGKHLFCPACALGEL